MYFLNARELLRMMRTCRTLFRYGAPFVLRDIVLVVRLPYGDVQPPPLLSTYSRMLADPERSASITSLTCNYFVLDNTLGISSDQFPPFAAHATRIESLVIQFHREEVMSPAIMQWIASLPKLRQLKLSEYSEAQPSLQLLQSITAPLETFELCSMGRFTAVDLIPALSNFADSLQSLHITTADRINGPLLRSAGVSFPALRDLQWHSCHASSLTSLPWSRSFPTCRFLK